MKNKAWFDKDLYKEGLRSTKVLGGLLFVLLLLYSILVPVNVLAELSDYVDGDYISDIYSTFLSQMIFYFYFIIVITVPVITLKTFSFYTTRNGSDFYGSIPHKKQCLFISFSLATLTWILACTVLPSIISYIIFSIAGYMPINFIGFIGILAHILVPALLVMSAICIACAITGTLLTNIIATGIILFWPRFFIYVIRSILVSLTNYIIPDNAFWLGTQCNLVVDSIVNYNDITTHLFDTNAFIYTFIIAILYFVLATFLFIKRKSELAMQPAISRRLQATLCILIGLAVSLLPTLILVDILTSASDQTASTIVALFTFYIIVIVAMIIYELVTTRKVRNLIRIIPRTGILLVLHIAIVIGLLVSKNWIQNYSPDAEDISYVTFSSLNNSYTYDDSSSYIENIASSFQCKNEEVKQLIASAISNTKKTTMNYDEYTILATVKTGLFEHTRYISLNSETYNELISLVSEDSDYLDIYKNIPSPKANSISYSDNSSLTSEQLKDIYESAKEEIQSLDSGDWYSHLIDALYSSSSSSILTYEVDSNSSFEYMQIPIDDHLPNTFNKLIEYANANKTMNLSQFIDLLEEHDYSEDDAYFTIDIELVSPSDKSSEYWMPSISSSTIKTSTCSNLLTALAETKETAIDVNDSSTYTVKIYMDYSPYDTTDSQGSTYYLNVDPEILTAFVDSQN